MFPFFSSQKQSLYLQKQIDLLVKEYQKETVLEKKQKLAETIKEILISLYNQNNLNYLAGSQYKTFLIN